MIISLNQFFKRDDLIQSYVLLDMKIPKVEVLIKSKSFEDFSRSIHLVGKKYKRNIKLDDKLKSVYDAVGDELSNVLLNYAVLENYDSRYLQFGGLSLNMSVGIKRKQFWSIGTKKFSGFTLYLRISELLYIEPTKLLRFISNDTHRLQLLGQRMFPHMFGLNEIWKGTSVYKGKGREKYGFSQDNCILKPFLRSILKMHDRSKHQYLFGYLSQEQNHWSCLEVLHLIRTINFKFFKLLNSSELEILSDFIREYLSLSKYEFLTWDFVLKRFQDVRFSWFDTLKNPSLSRQTFIYWYFKEFLKPILLKFFYITDSDFYGNKVFFIPRTEWNEKNSNYESLFISSNFKEFNDFELPRESLGQSKFRLIPKSRGLRAILNLSHKNEGESVNDRLKAASSCVFSELKKSIDYKKQIYSLLNVKDLQSFFAKMKVDSPNIYIVKADFESAYDSIDQQICLTLLRSLLKKKEYPVIDYFECKLMDSGMWLSAKRSKGFSNSDSGLLSENISELPKRFAFLEPMGRSQFLLRSEILDLVERHISCNLVEIKGKKYLQKKGIPQGSVLSSSLCTLFFKDFLTPIITKLSKNCHLAHFIDDILFFSTEQEECEKFLDFISEPSFTHGLKLSTTKTWLNFEYKNYNFKKSAFVWCGLNIKLDEFQLTRDYTKYLGRDIRYFITVSHIDKICHAFKVHVMPMLFDSSLNSNEIIVTNLIDHIWLATLKSIEVINVLRKRGTNIEIGQVVEAFRQAIYGLLTHLRTDFIRNNKTECYSLSYYTIEKICKRYEIKIKFDRPVPKYRKLLMEYLKTSVLNQCKVNFETIG
eukprot:NODE_537_length_6324_cov_1.677430.p1 type:complete len:817 gc:universal NODE_537_length_6324_cov_1.677430:3366-5816(+)